MTAEERSENTRPIPGAHSAKNYRKEQRLRAIA